MFSVWSPHKQDRTGSEDGDRDAERDPKRQSQLEKDGQHDKDQYQTLSTVANQHVQTIANIDRLVSPRDKLVTRRHALLVDVAFDRVDDIEQVLGTRPLHPNDHPRLAIDLVEGDTILEGIVDICDIPDRHHVAIGQSHQLDLFNARAIHLFVLATNHEFLATGANIAARHFEILLPDNAGDLLQRQTMPLERLFRDFDIDLIGPRPGDHGRSDAPGLTREEVHHSNQRILRRSGRLLQ